MNISVMVLPLYMNRIIAHSVASKLIGCGIFRTSLTFSRSISQLGNTTNSDQNHKYKKHKKLTPTEGVVTTLVRK